MTQSGEAERYLSLQDDELNSATITLFTGRSVLSSGVRQMAFGLAAAAVTYLIGRLIGVSLGG
jgi:hypothetical protein